MFSVPSYGREEYEGKPVWFAPAGVAEMQNCHFRIRRCFSRNELDGARLQIAAESYYALFVNGTFVGNGPARGTYSCNFLDEYEIDQYLVDGENFIAAEVFCNNYPTFLASPAEPAVFIRVGDCIADEGWEVQVADDWRSQGLHKYTMQIGAMEWRDWRCEPIGWQRGLDDSSWQNAIVICPDSPIYSKRLFKRDVAMLKANSVLPARLVAAWTTRSIDLSDVNVAATMATEPLEPYQGRIDCESLQKKKTLTIHPPADGDGVSMVVDFGQEFIGGVQLDLEASEGMVLDIAYDEVAEDGRLVPRKSVYRFADRHVLREGRQSIVNHLHWRGGRHVQLTFRNLKKPIQIHSLSMSDQRYPANFASFTSSDDELNELWKRSVATMSACAVDTFIDCPWREIAFWVNDFVVQQEFWQQLVGKNDIVKRSFALALSQPAADGLIPGVCPSDDHPRHVLFPTNLFLCMILKDYELYSGDARFVDELLPTVTKIFDQCQKYSSDNGVLSCPKEYWNFTDWSYGLSEEFSRNDAGCDDSVMCIVNWFNVLAANALASLYESRDSAKSAHYDSMAGSLAECTIGQFWNPRADRFNEFPDREDIPASKVAHALALLSGHLDETQTELCQQALMSNECLTPELYMMHFVFKAFVKNGMHDHVISGLNKYWLPMLETDCPTVWEANVHQHGKAAFGDAGSMCHAFSLTPVSFMQQEVLGVKPLENGFETFRLSPKSCGLKWASGTIPTPQGFIDVQWTKQDDEINVKVTIPSGLKAITDSGAIIPEGVHEVALKEELSVAAVPLAE